MQKWEIPGALLDSGDGAGFSGSWPFLLEPKAIPPEDDTDSFDGFPSKRFVIPMAMNLLELELLRTASTKNN